MHMCINVKDRINNVHHLILFSLLTLDCNNLDNGNLFTEINYYKMIRIIYNKMIQKNLLVLILIITIQR
jgi:hypothetical protein